MQAVSFPVHSILFAVPTPSLTHNYIYCIEAIQLFPISIHVQHFQCIEGEYQRTCPYRRTSPTVIRNGSRVSVVIRSSHSQSHTYALPKYSDQENSSWYLIISDKEVFQHTHRVSIRATYILASPLGVSPQWADISYPAENTPITGYEALYYVYISNSRYVTTNSCAHADSHRRHISPTSTTGNYTFRHSTFWHFHSHQSHVIIRNVAKDASC